MSWPKNYVLVPERRPGGEVRKLANSMAEHYGVPTQNLFSGSNDEATAFDNFRVATEDCCKASDMSTKLIVCGHGGPDRAHSIQRKIDGFPASMGRGLCGGPDCLQVLYGGQEGLPRRPPE